MDAKPAWYAAMNAVQYAAYGANNQAEMSIPSALIDKFNLEEKVRKYLKKLDGLQLTIPVSDIAHDLNMTEEGVIKILERWQMQLDDEEREQGFNS
ncbi:MAG: hypothetical protein ABIA92_03000, partial [Patescibacteria group bacterium]